MESLIQVTPIIATQLYKGTKGNDTWALVLLDSIPPDKQNPTVAPPACIQTMLDQHMSIFQDPKKLRPPRCYDHAIPLVPGAIPVNARPYHYSPQQKTKIEQQVQQLLEAGLITHTHSPFASPVSEEKHGT